MAKTDRNARERIVKAPQLEPSESNNDLKFQRLYDALEDQRKRLAANPRRLYGRVVVEVPYEASVVQQVAVTDKRIER